ncbi:Cellulose synthase-like protein G2 [Striga hermonthica]|uniref:Cellulose synthase-like protein G2 n=1 Tax=Striga hermonthica TaxID=68872 RepID=A0A9N7MHX7_STRHE|nr:Cellulose synthase-like protein G2 [Striga hermonthica]
MAEPLNVRRVLWKNLVINRLHMLLNAAAILAVFYYRATTLRRIIRTRETPVVPYLVVILSEAVLTFLWILHQAFRWIPVNRTVYPERLPEDDNLSPVDVFVCTADPIKEPSLVVMNTVISAMSLDYPPDKLAVYLHDDGGSHVTLLAVREAWKFATWWIPFCRKYELSSRCPQLYFEGRESADEKFIGTSEFVADRKIVEKKYGEFQDAIEKNSVDAPGSVSRDHSPTIEVMTEGSIQEMPLLVYVSREKRPGHPHHFKGGALNTLLRVSALISNAPYFLVLDCDMYCEDPSSARQAMCFYLDPKISHEIAWVQFPQKFRNTSKHDIYDGRLYSFLREGRGLDGVRGPTIYGCNFFMTREAIYGFHRNLKDIDINQMKDSFGASNEFIKSINRNYSPQLPEHRKPSEALEKELRLVATCTYDNDTKWGVGYTYFSVVEDAITSLELHCKGWISVLLDPVRPCFLGSCTTKLNDMLVQQTRWSFGLMQIGLSRYTPLIYGPLRMSVLQRMGYGALIFDCLYTVPFYGLGIIPPLCLVLGIPLYPKISDPMFLVFAFIFISSQLKHVQEVISYGDDFMTAVYELRVWMMKSGSCHFYAILNAVSYRLGLLQANFTLTNKAVDEDEVKRYEVGIYDFQISPLMLTPMCSLYLLNLLCCVIGAAKLARAWDELLAQAVLALFGVVVNWYFLQGMFFRLDSGRVSTFVTLISVVLASVVLGVGFLVRPY